jgi:hypothetical protein
LGIESKRRDRLGKVSFWQQQHPIFLRRLLVHFYVTHRHEKSSQQWRPWWTKGCCCFHRSFHRNRKRWFGWLLCEGKMSHLSIQSVRNWAQASRERTAIVDFLVFVVQFECVPWYCKDWKKGIAESGVRLVGRGPPNNLTGQLMIPCSAWPDQKN